MPDQRYEGVVKYRSKFRGKDGWKECLERYLTLNSIKAKAVSRITERLSSWQVCAHDEIDAGDAFDTKVSVLYWLIQKK